MEEIALYYFDKTGCHLWVPGSFVSAVEGDINAICNGCGTKGLGGYLVPDNIAGVDATIVCNIHDWMYDCATNEEEEDLADYYFRENLRRLIKSQNSKKSIVNWIRLRVADVYFVAVALTYCCSRNKTK
jgi:hypothetical protein